MKKYLLPESGNFYKANLHCHSTFSDGRLTPEEIKTAYMARGYSIIAYTDHDIMIPHDELAEENFLPLHGYEMEVNEIWDYDFSLVKTCHMCLIALEPDNLKQVCWHRNNYLFGNAPNYRDQVQFEPNEPDYVRTYTPECISDMMKKGRDHGFFVTYNHPNWSMEDYRQYCNYHNMHAMEICNYGCMVSINWRFWLGGVILLSLPMYLSKLMTRMEIPSGKAFVTLQKKVNLSQQNRPQKKMPRKLPHSTCCSMSSRIEEVRI